MPMSMIAFKSGDRHTTRRLLEAMRSVLMLVRIRVQTKKEGKTQVNTQRPRFHFVLGSDNINDKSREVVTISAQNL